MQMRRFVFEVTPTYDYPYPDRMRLAIRVETDNGTHQTQELIPVDHFTPLFDVLAERAVHALKEHIRRARAKPMHLATATPEDAS